MRVSERLREPRAERGAVLQLAFVDDEGPPAERRQRGEGFLVARPVAGDFRPPIVSVGLGARAPRGQSCPCQKQPCTKIASLRPAVDDVRLARQIGAMEPVARRNLTQASPALQARASYRAISPRA